MMKKTRLTIETVYRLGQAARGKGNKSYDIIKHFPQGSYATVSSHKSFQAALKEYNKIKDKGDFR